MTAQSVQSPVGGLNTFDSVDDMPAEDAAILVNWVPEAGFCRTRGGSSAFRDTGIANGNVGTIVDFEYGTSNDFICAVDDSIVDITAPVPVVLGSGFVTPRWQTVVFNSKLIMVNGSDAPQEYDGTTLAPITITGPVPASLDGLNVFKGRVYYWENSSAQFWYAAAGGYAGALESFDLSLIAKRGGVIRSMFTFSLDAGDGMDDFAVFLMSTGEALVYQGDDPGDVAAWSLVGKYKMGEPINVRGNVSVAGDEIVLTRSGWQSFKAIMMVGEYKDSPLTRKISRASSVAAADYGNNVNWDAIFYPSGPYIIINIPVKDGSTYTQHIMNSQTGAWSTFEGLNGNTFSLLDRQLVMGGSDGIVYLADTGPSDSGMEIQTDALPAYNYLSGRANQKQLTGVRVISSSSEPSRIAIAATADYRVPDRPNPLPSAKQPSQTPWGSPWGSAWEGNSSGLGQVRGEWQSKNAFGYSISYRMATSSNYEQVTWLSTQLSYRDGGII